MDQALSVFSSCGRFLQTIQAWRQICCNPIQELRVGAFHQQQSHDFWRPTVRCPMKNCPLAIHIFCPVDCDSRRPEVRRFAGNNSTVSVPIEIGTGFKVRIASSVQPGRRTLYQRARSRRFKTRQRFIFKTLALKSACQQLNQLAERVVAIDNRRWLRSSEFEVANLGKTYGRVEGQRSYSIIRPYLYVVPLRYLRSEKAVVRSEGGRAADPYSAGQACQLTTSGLRDNAFAVCHD